MDFSKFKLSESDEKLLNNLKSLLEKKVLTAEEHVKKVEVIYKKYEALQEENSISETDKKLLENLKTFHGKGVLSKEEFERKKGEIMKKYKKEEEKKPEETGKRRKKTLLRPNLNDQEQKILESLEGLLEKKTLSETEFTKKKEDLYNKARLRIEKEQQQQPQEEKKKVTVKKKFSELTEEEKKKVMEKSKNNIKSATDKPPVVEKLDLTKIRKDIAYAIENASQNHNELKELDFTDVAFTETQANQLFVALENNTNVTRLLMTNAKLGGGCATALSNMIKKNKKITT
jgi:hypothetical protein